MLFKKKQIELTEEMIEEIRIKDFFDRILPSTIKFSTDHYIIGDSYRCVWAIKEYPPTTEELALFSQLADRNNLTVRLYSRLVDALEQRKIIQNATRRNKLSTGSNDAVENITAEGNLQDVVTLIAELRKNKEPLLHCAVYSTLKLAKELYKSDNCQSQSEFIEKAIIFYAGYLSSNKNSEYLPNIITSTLKSIVKESDNRLTGAIFKIAVELAITMNLIASSQDVDKVTLDRLRGECVR